MDVYKTIEDEKLVKEIRSKDKELFRYIIDRYQNKLIRYVTYLVRDKNKAAEIVQETFIKAFINLNGFNINKKFSSWIYRIAHNQSINIIKKHYKEVQLNEKLNIFHSQDIEEEVNKKEMIKKIHKCINQISIRYSEPLSLHFLEDKSYDEISDILQIPIGTVGTRINRAKSLMKKICQNNK